MQRAFVIGLLTAITAGLAAGDAAGQYSYVGTTPLYKFVKMSSSAFERDKQIPPRFTCSGANLSPPLAWSGLPDGTRELAIIADDPDAPGKTWVHWVAYNIPPTAEGLPEGIPKGNTAAGGLRQGKNDFGQIGYGGPCPPAGKPHTYKFKLYALKTKLDLPPGKTAAELEKAMEGQIIGLGNVTGTFERPAAR